MTTDYDLLMRGVLINPRENLPRLVLADYLEENGQDRRAELIRKDIAGELGPVSGSVIDAMLDFAAAAPLTFPPRRRITSWTVGFGVSSFTCSRGFVYEVSLGTADFLTNAAAVFSRHPVTSVDLIDRTPDTRFHPVEAVVAPPGVRRDEEWYRATVEAYPGEAWYLPEPIFDRLPNLRLVESALTPGFPLHALSARSPSLREARSVLSAACVAYGRELAGLPPLPEV